MLFTHYSLPVWPALRCAADVHIEDVEKVLADEESAREIDAANARALKAVRICAQASLPA